VDVDGRLTFLNTAFFGVLVSTLLLGTTFAPPARGLRATTEEPALPRPLVEVGSIRQLGADVVEVPIHEGDAVIGVRVRDLGLPREALVNVLVRNDEALPPRGSTRLEAGDLLYIVARQSAVAGLREARERWRVEELGDRVYRLTAK
jgi:cell volume regulation protein A